MMATIAGWFLSSKTGRSILLYGALALSVALFLLFWRRGGEKAGRMAERVENIIKALEVKDAQQKAAMAAPRGRDAVVRSEEHTSELQSLMRISYAVFFFTKKQ